MHNSKILACKILINGFIFLWFLTFNGCKEKDDDDSKEIATEMVHDFTFTSAWSGGEISEIGFSNISEKGICWSEKSSPTILDNHTNEGPSVAEFKSKMTRLEINTIYYVRAYVTDDLGTFYGNERIFKTNNFGEFVDSRDGKIYKITTIKNQLWFAENLNFDTNNSWCYYGFDRYCDRFGKLYNWETANKVCPKGWHLPTDEEWQSLSDYLGGDNLAGGVMKVNDVWKFPNLNATNESGFFGLPGGNKSNFDHYNAIFESGNWWSATGDAFNTAWMRNLHFEHGRLSKISYLRTNFVSCRCVKDY